MTRHLLRLIWNRKRHNVLLAIEMLFAFLVLFGVVLFAVQYLNNYRLPLGYDYEPVWVIQMQTQEPDQEDAVKQRHREIVGRLLAELRALPEIEVASASNTAPLINARWESGHKLKDGRDIQYGANRTSDEFRDAIDLELLTGRWFTREDDGVAWEPVVVNARLAEFVWDSQEVVGKTVPIAPDSEEDRRRPDYRPQKDRRVIGVIRDFRQFGDLAKPDMFMFFRSRLDDPDPKADVPRMLVVRLRPGTTAAFEETLVKRLQGVARNWSFDVRPLVERREANLRSYLTPLILVGTVAAFLLIMVVLGLTGVVWQNVTQRTREFGLRRAKGATVSNVRQQVLTELVILTTIALLAGALLVLQLPMLPLPPDMTFSRPIFLTAVALTALIIYMITFIAGWYPSRLATKVQPAEALHYE
jgi:putative ABC transport system permease protein